MRFYLIIYYYSILFLVYVIVLSNLVARTQLIDSQNLSGAESFCKQVNCPHLSTEHTVHVRRL